MTEWTQRPHIETKDAGDGKVYVRLNEIPPGDGRKRAPIRMRSMRPTAQPALACRRWPVMSDPDLMRGGPDCGFEGDPFDIDAGVS